MNVSAVPAPVTTRNSIPTTSVQNQTGMPVPKVSGQQPERQRTSAHPAAAPTRNGSAVPSAPVTGSSWAWLARPTAANTRTDSTSRAAATGIPTRVVEVGRDGEGTGESFTMTAG